MRVTSNGWQSYVDKARRINDEAGRLMEAWIRKNGTSDRNAVIRYAMALIERYGEASGALACEVYEAQATAQKAIVRSAEMVELPSYGEVARTVNGALKQGEGQVPRAVSRQVKQIGADTTLYNALRDKAQFAWVPMGDTCAFCITLASRGWQNMSKKALKNGHAEHIHANCDCQYAVRFDGKSTVEGYDPDKYLEMYENAEGDTPDEKINSMRRALNSTGGKFTSISDNAILKVPLVNTTQYGNVGAKRIQEEHRNLLKYAKDHNDSKEVSISWSFDFTRNGGYVLGDTDNTRININGLGDRIFVMHNHPNGAGYSNRDIIVFLKEDRIGALSIVTNDGNVEVLEKTDKYSAERAKVILKRCVKNLDDSDAKGYDKAIRKFITRYANEGGIAWRKS